MKRLILLLGLLSVVLSSLWCTSPLSSSQKEELIEIINELENLTQEQATIIETSKKRNEELENSSKRQEQRMNELESLSNDKTMIIQEQRKTIDEQKSLLEKPKTSSTLTWMINALVAAIAAFFGGFFFGKIFL